MQKPEKQEELKVLCRLKTVESPRCLSHPGTTGATQPALQELSEKHPLFCFQLKANDLPVCISNCLVVL